MRGKYLLVVNVWYDMAVGQRQAIFYGIIAELEQWSCSAVRLVTRLTVEHENWIISGRDFLGICPQYPSCWRSH